jgi:hypothetical protein
VIDGGMASESSHILSPSDDPAARKRKENIPGQHGTRVHLHLLQVGSGQSRRTDDGRSTTTLMFRAQGNERDQSVPGRDSGESEALRPRTRMAASAYSPFPDRCWMSRIMVWDAPPLLWPVTATHTHTAMRRRRRISEEGAKSFLPRMHSSMCAGGQKGTKECPMHAWVRWNGSFGEMEACTLCTAHPVLT